MGQRGAPPAFARSAGRSVAVLGGGMAGLAAAHELAERGFKVTVYEPHGLGRQGPQHPGAGHRRRRAPGPARRARVPVLPRLLPPRPRLDAAHPVRRATRTASGTTWSTRTEGSSCAPATAPTRSSSASARTRRRCSPSTACVRYLTEQLSGGERAAARARLLRRARCWCSSRAATSGASASGSTSAGGTSSAPRAVRRSTRRCSPPA